MRTLLLGSAAALLVVLLPIGGQAQVVTCLDPGGFPVCEGSCLPGQACVNAGTQCACEPTSTPCEAAGGPTCDGDCPPDHACQLFSGGCQCQLVPALSTWGAGAMAVAMLAFVLFRSSRQERPVVGNNAKA